MKKILLALFVLAISFNTYAQQKGNSESLTLDKIEKTTASIVDTDYIKMSPNERAIVYTDRMAVRLNLNEAQKKQVYLVNLDAANKMEEIRPIQKIDESLYNRKKKSLTIDSNAKIERELSKEQISIFHQHIGDAQHAKRAKANLEKVNAGSKK